MDEPIDLPDGSEIELEIVENDDEWSPELDAELLARAEAAARGEVVTAADAIARLRRR
ncbi:hypothetical protein [Sandaracinus amylolyticus]|uniref:Uncharacterized protein n=1 Tax=Sandaracinus amylolyticus TaxID=927083 RepID=A0A0F6YN35_9BACT|nr:hypothetical protein [Sandaracinus amylolyticus]AKF10822.1 hypothetical protein DB32_007971 [Sandaracinus amylolyticus]